MVGITGSNGRGTGFFVDVDRGRPGFGYILTSYSLVSGGCQVAVQLPLIGPEIQAPSFQGRLYAKDEILDLALIEIDDSTSPKVGWANRKEVKIDDRVFAFGFSETYEFLDNLPVNLLEGVVKDLPADALSGEGNAPETSLGALLVLTDINTIPDFQGGPLLNLEGEVLGINAANLDYLDVSAAAPLSPSLFAQGLIDVIPRLGSSATILTTTPSSPVAGRPVSFTLETQPHQIVKVTLLDPNGQEVPWIYPEGDTRIDNGQPVTTRTLGADACGKVEWLRHGFRDIPGDWTVSITLGPFADQPQSKSFNYTVSDLNLEDQGKIHFGIDLRRYQGPESQVFYSDLVPAALVVDLQSQLAGVVDLLDDRLGVRTAEIPDLYLMGNRSHFDKVRGFMGLEQLGFAPAAYFAFPCPKCFQVKKSGIYVWVDTHDSETRLLQTITHEYAHALVNAIAKDRGEVLPIWVNEGFAEWSENLVGFESNEAPAATQSWFDDADLVRSAALSGNLMTLSSLESDLSWKSRTGDQVTLQYAEAYMAVRYLTETYGQPAIVDLISDFTRRGNLSLAIGEAAGISYQKFETQFNSWLEKKEPTDAYYQRGRDHYSAGEYHKAVDELSIVLKLDPNRDGAYNRRGLAYDRLEEYQLAIEDFDESIRLEPRSGRFRNRGSSYYRLGQYQRAIEDFDQAIRFDGSYANAYNWRGTSYYQLEQYQRAVDSYETAVRLEPTAARLTNRGSAYYGLEQYRRAIEDFDEAIRLDPGYARAYGWRASSYGKLGQEQEQRSDRDKACSLNSQYC